MENLVKHQKVSKYYDHYCLQNFLLLFMSLLAVPNVKVKTVLMAGNTLFGFIWYKWSKLSVYTDIWYIDYFEYVILDGDVPFFCFRPFFASFVQKSIWHYDVTWLICQQFFCRNGNFSCCSSETSNRLKRYKNLCSTHFKNWKNNSFF